MGTLCAMDTQVRAFGEVEQVVLSEFAKIAEDLLSAKEFAAKSDGVLQYAMEREKLFRDTFEQAPIGIIHTSLHGLILRMNQRACALLGYSPAELRELSIPSITHPEDLQQNIREFKRDPGRRDRELPAGAAPAREGQALRPSGALGGHQARAVAAAGLQHRRDRGSILRAMPAAAEKASGTAPKAAEGAEALRAAQKQIEAREKSLGEAQAALEARQKSLSEAQAALEARQKSMGEAQAALDVRNKSWVEAQTALEARQKSLSDAQAALEARQKSVGDAQAALKEREKALSDAQAALKERENALSEARSALEAREKALSETQASIKERDDSLSESQTALKERDKSAHATPSRRRAPPRMRCECARGPARRARDSARYARGAARCAGSTARGASRAASGECQLAAESATDALTVLPNRRSFSRRSEQAANALRQSRKPYGLISARRG